MKMAAYKLIHVLAVTLWVGGIFFAYMVLRPTAAEVLQPPERLKLWDKAFYRFFNWVWLLIYLFLTTGFYMVYQFGGLPHVPGYIHLMLGLGMAMVLVFIFLFFRLYVPFNLRVARQEWAKAGEILTNIRKLVALNLVLGILTFAVAVLGRGM
jgi:uncharacterized membrane protein